jgi:hypothetical protein
MSSFSDAIEIAATPEAVFNAVSRLEDMGRFSPENTGGRWLGGAAGPAIGARFKGTNANGARSWTTTARVVECDPPREFAFEVTVGPVRVSRWSYVIEPTEGGSRVTESWIDRRSGLSKRLTKGIVADREAYTRQSIATTLAELKAFLER